MNWNTFWEVYFDKHSKLADALFLTSPVKPLTRMLCKNGHTFLYLSHCTRWASQEDQGLIYFLMRNEPNIDVGYVSKIEAKAHFL